MKLLVYSIVAVVWLQMPIGGKAMGLLSGGPLARMQRSDCSCPQNVDTSPKMTQSNLMYVFLNFISESDDWKDFVLYMAKNETIEEPAFRQKWGITAEDETKRQQKKMEVTAKERQDLDEFVKSGKWSALVSMFSTKAEFLNEKYRADHSLGELSDDVRNSIEGGNYFIGPQWKEFVRLAKLDVSGKNDEGKLQAVVDWMMGIRRIVL